MSGKRIFVLILCAALAVRFLCPGFTAALRALFRQFGGGEAVRVMGRLLEGESRVFLR